MSRDHKTPQEEATDAMVELGAALIELSDEISQLRNQIAQQAHRLGSVEQAGWVAGQRLANVEHATAIKDTTTDRSLAALLGQVDAVLIELEPNGQVKATGVRGDFHLSSANGYLADGIWEARAEVGAPASHALTGLNAYIYHSRQDQFAGSAGELPFDLPSNVVRQVQSEGEEF